MPTALARMTRKALSTAAVVAAATGITVLASGTATAADQAVAPSCTAAVAAPIGQQVVVPGSAVQELVRLGAEEAKTRLLQATWPNELAKEIAGEQLTVGAVPNARTSTIGGQTIGAEVGEALEGHWALGVFGDTKRRVLETIVNKVSGNCGLTLSATDYVAPTTPSADRPDPAPNASHGAPATSGPGSDTAVPGTEAPLGSGSATAPPRDYSGIPAATAPTAGISVPPSMRYSPSSGVPGAPGSPEFGILGADRAGSGDGSSDVRNAGNADALAAPDTPSQVQLPMLLAVVALAGVTAALVRTWVLRRVS
ncbi:hypothetical protein ACFS2C_26135 [Prauserella oleivorans]|uniref:Uncharacterized protein n=1 Tax=Prauserella oleivorans TaxID=1478153 RepID=A0ABW5WFV7_9PSEU